MKVCNFYFKMMARTRGDKQRGCARIDEYFPPTLKGYATASNAIAALFTNKTQDNHKERDTPMNRMCRYDGSTTIAAVNAPALGRPTQAKG